MHRKMLTLLMCVFLASAVSVSAQQGENDQGEWDTLTVEFPVFPDVATGQNKLQMDLYIYNDVQGLGSVSSGFKWVNPNLQMDSTVILPLADDSWDFFTYTLRNNILDSTNIYQVFQFAAARILGTGLNPGPSRKLVASYHFTVSDWTVNDSIVLDTTVFSSGTYMKFNDLTNKPFIPYWAGKRVLRDTSFTAPSNLVVPIDTVRFSAIEGAADPTSQTFVVFSDFDPLAFNLIESAGWMAPTPTGGTTPATITVNVTTLGLSEGVYFDSIRVQSAAASNSPQYVYVELDVTPPPPVIGISSSEFFFVAQEGGANPATQTLSISNIGGQTLSWDVSNSSSWLSLSPGSGFEDGDVLLEVDITGLMFGEYSDAIYVSSAEAANSPVVIPVNLVVGTDLPMIDVDTVIYWPVAVSELPIFFRSFEVRNSGEGAMDFWVVEETPLVKSVSPASSTAPDSVELSLGILESVLPLGAETTFVAQVFSNEAINSPFLVRFRIRAVDDPAVIDISQTSVEFDMFGCQQGYGQVAPSTDITVTNIGGDNPMSVELDYEPGLISAELDYIGPATNSVRIRALQVDLPFGTYFDTINVVSNWAANSPQQIVVQYNHLPPANDPVIHLERTEIVLPWRENAGPVTIDGPDIYNEYGGCMPWQITESIPWLAPQETSGEVPGLTDLVVNPLGYTLGEYVGTMQVVAPDATNSPQEVIVRLQVWKLVGDMNWDGIIDIEDIQQLIGYLFLSMEGDPIPTWEVGDTNCDGSIDVTDAQYLVDNLFMTLTPLCTNPY
ncbi:MAG: hypothetical protein GY867_08140 [bacterium]|nr:hypothetical protein [bacterium]